MKKFPRNLNGNTLCLGVLFRVFVGLSVSNFDDEAVGSDVSVTVDEAFGSGVSNTVD